MNQIIKIIVAGLLVTIGFATGRWTTQRTPPPEPTITWQSPSLSQSASTISPSSQRLSASSTTPEMSKNSSIFGELTPSNINQLTAQIEQLSSPLRKAVLNGMLAEKWMQTAPIEALNYLYAQDPGPGNPNMLLLENLTRFAKEDPDAAMDWIQQQTMEEPNQSAAIAAVLAGMATIRPLESIELANALPTSRAREDALFDILNEWSKNEPRAALDWFETQKLTPRLYHAYFSCILHFIDKDPTEAGLIIQTLDPGDLKSELVVQYAERLAQNNAQAALDWAQKLPNEEMRCQALNAALSDWAASNPELALDYTLSLPPGTEQNELVMLASAELYLKSPGTMAAHIDRLPEDVRPQIIPALARTWTEKDPASAHIWLESLPSGEIRDKALTGFFQAEITHNPEKACLYAQAIENAYERYQLLRDAVKEWSQLDPQTAKQLVMADARLSDEEKGDILEYAIAKRPVSLILPAKN